MGDTNEKTNPIMISDKAAVAFIEQEAAKTGEPKAKVAARLLNQIAAVREARADRQTAAA